MDTIGERIRAIRKEKGLTLIAFGDKIGISNPAVSNIENGKTNPSNQTILAICREFGVDEVWLRTGVGDPFCAKTRKDKIAEYFGQVLAGDRTETEELLIEVMSETPVDEWLAIANVLKRYADKTKKPGTD